MSLCSKSLFTPGETSTEMFFGDLPRDGASVVIELNEMAPFLILQRLNGHLRGAPR